jgi:hypothetical protein
MTDPVWDMSGQIKVKQIKVDVLFGTLSARKITVSPIGEVNRNPKINDIEKISLL